MTQNVNPTFVKTPNAAVTVISTNTAPAGSFVIVYNGGANGSKITGVQVTNSTSQTQDVRAALTSPSTSQGVFNAVSSISLSGVTSGSPPINLLQGANLPLDSDGNPYVFLPSSAWSLSIELGSGSTTWAGGNTMIVTVLAGDF